MPTAQVRDLVYKRGFAKINGQRVPITDNNMIEEALSEKTKGAVICMEDIVHQIHTVGPHFKEANNFLSTFKLSAPKGGFKAKVAAFMAWEDQDGNNREDDIAEDI